MNRGSRNLRDRRDNQNFSKENWGQDEYVEAGPLNEDELKGTRQWNDRVHYGSSATSQKFNLNRFHATTEEYPLRRMFHPGERKNFSSVGPKNYKRSDDRIEEDVCNVLMKDRNIDASNIEVHVRSGVVILSGTVDSRMDKIEAEMAIEEIAGVEDIQNEIKLKKWGDYSDRPYQREYGDRNPGEKDKDKYS